MRQLLTALLVFISVVAFSQSTTYSNNYGTNIMNGQVGNFNKSSFSWTVSKAGKLYTISTDAVSRSFNVTYSHTDKANNLYVYKVKGTGLFDGNAVKLVMTNGKLSDYAKGSLEGGNVLTILFIDNTGYIYKLKV